MNRPKANPFNFTVWAKVSQIIFKGSAEEIIFGSQNNAPINYNEDYNEDNNEGDE